jgi:primosomal protein N' (replication factor Y)
VDEEHDDSYKQDEGVPYNARDLAVVLGKIRKCPVVLASATPAIESWYNAKTGHYSLLHLPKRATPRDVPNVQLVDLTAIQVEEGKQRPIFSTEAVSALQGAFDAGGKAIVLYNRRGYATLIQCTSCGGTYECPNCGISMTLHQRSSRMSCHYCNLSLSYTGECPICRSRSLEELGKGTERIVEELEALFPDIPIARMDADTTGIRGAHHRILSDFREGKTRLLVGTQIVAKGHDFPDVHTAVVVSADQGFRLPDFRAGERTFALLVQMAGRAGRGERAGHVVVQTWKPDHYVLKNLDNVDDFYRRELRLRDAMRYPPFSRLCLIRVDGINRRQVGDATADLARSLRQVAREHAGVAVLGPAMAALAKLVGRWRYQIILRGQQLKEFRQFIHAVHPILERASRKGIRVRWDVDPRSLL